MPKKEVNDLRLKIETEIDKEEAKKVFAADISQLSPQKFRNGEYNGIEDVHVKRKLEFYSIFDRIPYDPTKSLENMTEDNFITFYLKERGQLRRFHMARLTFLTPIDHLKNRDEEDKSQKSEHWIHWRYDSKTKIVCQELMNLLGCENGKFWLLKIPLDIKLGDQRRKKVNELLQTFIPGQSMMYMPSNCNSPIPVIRQLFLNLGLRLQTISRKDSSGNVIRYLQINHSSIVDLVNGFFWMELSYDEKHAVELIFDGVSKLKDQIDLPYSMKNGEERVISETVQIGDTPGHKRKPLHTEICVKKKKDIPTNDDVPTNDDTEDSDEEECALETREEYADELDTDQ
jgi:hypothetical protein